MSKVVMYCTRLCPYCQMAIRLLEKKGAEIDKIQVDEQPERHQEMSRLTGSKLVPQIFIDDKLVGGYTELVEMDMDGELDAKLAGSAA